MKKFNTTTIKTLAEFIENLQNRIVNKNRVLLFRGQTIDKALIPKIARTYYDKGREIGERRMFEEFKLLSKSFLTREPSSELEWLAVAQHHGLPTRLLDWTENPLTAAFFATNKKPDKGQTHSVIWALSFERESVLFVKDHINFNISNQKGIKFYKPANITDRISAQMGWFSIHQFKGQGFYLQAESIEDETVRINKILIPAECIEEFNYRLNVCGINEYTIYKDLDSLSRYLYDKYKNDIA
jgi:hypothetical protein